MVGKPSGPVIPPRPPPGRPDLPRTRCAPVPGPVDGAVLERRRRTPGHRPLVGDREADLPGPPAATNASTSPTPAEHPWHRPVEGATAERPTCPARPRRPATDARVGRGEAERAGAPPRPHHAARISPRTRWAPVPADQYIEPFWNAAAAPLATGFWSPGREADLPIPTACIAGSRRSASARRKRATSRPRRPGRARLAVGHLARAGGRPAEDRRCRRCHQLPSSSLATARPVPDQ